VPFPKPEPGLVIRYSYLWLEEYKMGREEGVKDRPCAVILVTKTDRDDEIVTVLPVTHTPPAEPAFALEIPPETKRRLGLDHDRSWIVLTESNRFIWLGPDLRPAIGGDPDGVAYGFLPAKFYERMRSKFIAILKSNRAAVAPRSG